MAEKYQDILSFLDQSSSSPQSEGDERVTARSLTSTVAVLIDFLHALGIDGAIHLHHLKPGKGFSRRHDAGIQRVAQGPRAQAKDHRACDFNAT